MDEARWVEDGRARKMDNTVTHSCGGAKNNSVTKKESADSPIERANACFFVCFFRS